MKTYRMKLTHEEKDVLEGKQGETMRKALESVVWYGETFDAERLAPIDHGGHLVTSFGIPLLKPVFSLMEELIDAGLTTKEPFTVDPRPMDFKHVKTNIIEQVIFKKVMYGKQKEYEKQLKQVGLKDDNAFSCTCYMDEVGNIPKRGDILSWAESSAVVYVNSVLGARCNRNSGVIELLGGITGKVPVFGLLTDEGRKADWVIELRTSSIPEAPVLGSAIGLKVMEDVPYIIGLDTYLGKELTQDAKDYLKDMGAATASNGAVGLYHVDGLTPEAKDLGKELVREGAKHYIIDDDELTRVKDSYPIMWKNPDAKPAKAFIGCPHLSQKQIGTWLERLEKALKAAGKKRVGIQTVMTAAPDVVEAVKRKSDVIERLAKIGVQVSSICPLMYMNNPLCAKKAVITNSNKLRTYTTARYIGDERMVRVLVRGKII